MKRRIWISLVVMAAMLVHAVLLARHDVVMFKAALRAGDAMAVQIQDFPAEAICHHEAPDTAGGTLPEKPPASPEKPYRCPICQALVAAYAISPGAAPKPQPRQVCAYVLFLPVSSYRSEFPKFRSPPTRGPPTLI